MAIITKDNTFIKGTVAQADEVNENFDTIYDEFNGSISNDNIVAVAAIEQTKIDSVIPYLTSLKIADKTDVSVQLEACEHSNADLGSASAADCVVGLDDAGFFPPTVMRAQWETGGDSNLVADTTYKISCGVDTFASYLILIDTGLTTIKSIVGIPYGGGEETVVLVSHSGGEALFRMYGNDNGQFYWIAIGT